MSRTPEELGYVQAELTMRRTEDGGRQTPIRTGYRPNWRLPGEAGHVWASGSVELVDAEELLPGRYGNDSHLPIRARGLGTSGSRIFAQDVRRTGPDRQGDRNACRHGDPACWNPRLIGQSQRHPLLRGG